MRKHLHSLVVAFQTLLISGSLVAIFKEPPVSLIRQNSIWVHWNSHKAVHDIPVHVFMFTGEKEASAGQTASGKRRWAD